MEAAARRGVAGIAMVGCVLFQRRDCLRNVRLSCVPTDAPSNPNIQDRCSILVQIMDLNGYGVRRTAGTALAVICKLCRLTALNTATEVIW